MSNATLDRRLPIAAGLTAGLATAIAWTGAGRPHDLSPAGLAAFALARIASVAAFSLLLALPLLRDRASARRRMGTRIVAAVVWLPPLFLFLGDPRLRGAMLGLLLRSPWSACLVRYRKRAPALVEADAGPIHTPRELHAMRDLLPMFGAAVLIQAGMAAGPGRPILATILIGGAAGWVAWRTPVFTSASPSRLRRRAVVSSAVALLFTMIGLAPYLREGYGGDGEGRGATSARAAEASTRKGDSPVDFGDSHEGVIIWPEVQRHTTLVPPLPNLGRGLSKMSKTDPLRIPFYGVYWLYRRPDSSPPKGSLVTHGDPVTKSFHSNDRRPLIMEARQNFGLSIDVSCCREIQVQIHTADRFPGSIEVELVLAAGQAEISLGRAEVRSIGNWPQAPEVLKFRMPPTPKLKSFDEARLRVHLARARADRSPRIAIDSFVLVPIRSR